jgi:hypothetical protein
MEENSMLDLLAIPQNTFQDAFQNRIKRWKRCIMSGGEYFEGDEFDEVVSKVTIFFLKFGFLMVCHRMYFLFTTAMNCGSFYKL